IHKQFRYRDVTLLLLAMLGHAGPIVWIWTSAQVCCVYFWAARLHSRKACSRAALMCFSLRCAKLGDARTETERASPRVIAAIRLFPIVMARLRDSKAYRFISLLNIWPLRSTPASRQDAQRCLAPGASPDRVHDCVKGLGRLDRKPAPRHPAFEPGRE